MMRNKELKLAIKKYLLKLTAYGVYQIVDRKKVFFKVFWILYVISALFVTLWFTYDSISSYLDFDYVTKVESIYEQPLRFPTITFCPYNENMFHDRKLKKDIILECWFNLDRDCENNPDNYFESFTDDLNFTCFRFNSGKNMTDHKIEYLNSSIGGRDDSFYLNISSYTGLWIWVHEPTLKPITKMFYNNDGYGVLSPAKFETQINIHKHVEQRLEQPYNNCYKNVSDFTKNKTIIDYILNKGLSYRQIDCLMYCFDIDYLENSPCECKNSSLGNVWSDCFIGYENQNRNDCTYNYKLNFTKSTLLHKCSEYCPLECESVEYLISTNSIGKESLYTQIVVYYRSLKHTIVKQLPKIQGFDLVSNIGGIFGLFVGLSFVSLFETIEFFIEITTILFKFKAKSRELLEYS